MSEYAGSSLNRWGRRVVLAVGSSIGVNVQTVSATVTLAAQSAMIQLINGGAASRDVALPVDAALAGGMQLDHFHPEIAGAFDSARQRPKIIKTNTIEVTRKRKEPGLN